MTLGGYRIADQRIACKRDIARMLLTMTRIDSSATARFAAMNSDAAAITGATIAHDFDEARFRAHLVTKAAKALGLWAIAGAAFEIEITLGPLGSAPSSDIGHAMLRLADLINPGRKQS